MAPLLPGCLSTGAGASTRAELQRLFLSVLPPYFESPQAVLSFPLAAAFYLVILRHCTSVEATWKPIEQLLMAMSTAMAQACLSGGRHWHAARGSQRPELNRSAL